MNRNALASAIIEYSHTITSKALTVVGGASAVVHLPASNWITDAGNWLYNWPWMTTLSFIAVLLLVIERGFIVWAWNRKRKRGEL